MTSPSSPAGPAPIARPQSDYLVQALLCLAIISAPFYYYRFPGIVFNVTLFRLFLVPATLVVLVRTLFGHRSKRILRAGLSLQVAALSGTAFLVLSVIQVARSKYPGALATLMIQCEGYLLIVTVYLWVNSWRRFRNLLAAYVVSVLIPGAIAFYQQVVYQTQGILPTLPLTAQLGSYLVQYDDLMFGGMHLQRIQDSLFARSASTMVDANFFGVFVACVSLVSIGVALRRLRSRGNFLARTAPYLGALSAFLLFLSMSRTAWLGFLVGAAYLVFRMLRFRKGRILGMVAIGSLSVLAMAIPAYYFDYDVPGLISSRILDSEQGMIARTEMMQQGFAAFLDSPLFGVGRSNLIAYTGYPTTHVFYLTRLSEDGLLGLMLVLGFIAALWLSTGFRAKHRGKQEAETMIDGIRAALLCLLAANCGYDHFMSLEVNWVLIAFFFAAAKLMSKPVAISRIVQNSSQIEVGVPKAGYP